MPNQVTIVGGEEAVAAMRRFVDQVAPEIADRAASWGEQFADVVRSEVPVVSGTMAGALTADTDTDGLTVGYDDSAPYAGWVEFGGSRGRTYEPAGRWLYPLAQAAEPDYVQMAERATSDMIEGFRWPRAK